MIISPITTTQQTHLSTCGGALTDGAEPTVAGTNATKINFQPTRKKMLTDDHGQISSRPHTTDFTPQVVV